MKKIFKVFMIAALVISCPIANVFADETETEIENIVNSDEGSVLLTAKKASSYSIQLPVSVDVSTSGAKVILKAKGDVDSAYKIVVAEKENATNKLVDAADPTNTVDITVTMGDAINGSAVGAAYADTAKTEITIAHDGLTAGTYSYELPLVISLQKITA